MLIGPLINLLCLVSLDVPVPMPGIGGVVRGLIDQSHNTSTYSTNQVLGVEGIRLVVETDIGGYAVKCGRLLEGAGEIRIPASTSTRNSIPPTFSLFFRKVSKRGIHFHSRGEVR